MDTILVVNAGSSSVKFQVFEVEGPQTLRRLISGQMDGIGVRPKLNANGAANEKLIERNYEATEVPDVVTATAPPVPGCGASRSLNVVAIGHRVVHGGPQYDRPTVGE